MSLTRSHQSKAGGGRWYQAYVCGSHSGAVRLKCLALRAPGAPQAIRPLSVAPRSGKGGIDAASVTTVTAASKPPSYGGEQGT